MERAFGKELLHMPCQWATGTLLAAPTWELPRKLKQMWLLLRQYTEGLAHFLGSRRLHSSRRPYLYPTF